MIARLFLHMRTLDSGRVIGTAIPFDGSSHDGDTPDEVRRAAARSVRDQLSDLSGSLRTELAEATTAELDAVEVEVGKAKLTVRFGLVVIRREGDDSAPYLVYAPEVPRFVVAATKRDEIAATAGKELRKFVSDWRIDIVAACHERGAVELEPLEVPFPATDGGGAQGVPLIESLADNLTVRAAEGRGARLDRREPIVERVLAALAAEGRSSVLLVGPGDVGKTALVGELAARLHDGNVPPALRDRPLLRLSANELIAGAQYTGMWQDRGRRLVAHARQTGAIIAMGDPGGIIDAGRWSQSANNLGRYLQPFLESGDLRLVCETTPDGLATVRRREPGFVELFFRVDVPEPDHDAVREILTVAAGRLQSNHGVEIDEHAVAAALRLTSRFEPYRAQPGKSVRLLEETVQMTAESAEPIGAEAVTRAFAARSGMPLQILSDEVRIDPAEVQRFFEDRVLGQDEAVAAMADLVAVIKAGLNDPGKPLGSFLFVGPTGVGKTELSKALAEYLFGSRERVLRFDMGEYASPDAAPKLIGSAWQRDDEGELTRRVREQPFCVLLLDEIEKAHASVFDVLLSAIGEGRLTDAGGTTADLRSAIVIMTSNLGARPGAGGVGFASGDGAARRRKKFVEEAEGFFRPEFFNRIDRLLVFDALSEASVRRIARRELGRILLREGITSRRLLVEVTDDVVEHLARAGFDARYGARPLHREIERAVVRPLARLLLEGRAAPGDLIRLRVAGGDIALDLHRVREAASAGEAPAPAPAPTEPAKPAARQAAQVEELRDRVQAAARAPAAEAARDALSAAVAETNAPDFWDRPADAREALSRSYELQRVFDDLRELTNRADGLVELARSVGRGRGAEIRTAREQIEHRLALIALELASASVDSLASRARVTCTPIGAAAEGWAQELLAMYAAWAHRTARTATPVRRDPHSITIDGLGAHALLGPEQGLHRREGPRRSDHDTVRVTVSANGRRIAAAAADEPGEIVRVYSVGRRTGVRDPRTGVVVGNVRAVLDEGRIDDFILASLASTEG